MPRPRRLNYAAFWGMGCSIWRCARPRAVQCSACTQPTTLKDWSLVGSWADFCNVMELKNCLVQPFAVWALIIGTVGQHPPLFAMDPCGESMVGNLIQLGAHSNLLKIYRQSAWTCPPLQVLIAVTLMVMWSTNVPPIQRRFQFLDLFAGVANATKVWLLGCSMHNHPKIVVEVTAPCSPMMPTALPRSSAGYATATVDESHRPGERIMNFLTPPGIILI